MKRFLMVFLLSISCVQNLSAAEIYQCEKDGRMQYSQTPCSQDQKAIGKKSPRMQQIVPAKNSIALIS
jgi:hypothetical protein